MKHHHSNAWLAGTLSCFILLAAGAIPGKAWANTDLEVTTSADSGPGSLRWALERAQGPGGPWRIHFGDKEGLFSEPQTIDLESPLPEITGNVTIDGFIANRLWTAYGASISAGGEHRILEIAPGGMLHLIGVTLTGGSAIRGGAALNRGRLIVEGVTMLENRAEEQGGAIANLGGEVFVINSTIADSEIAVDHQGERLKWDQRGNGDPRFAGGFADIGAFERQSQLATEYVVDTATDTGLRGCTAAGAANCPLRAAVELALADRKAAPIRFSPHVFKEPLTVELRELPAGIDRRPLEFDGAGAAPVTILVPGPDPGWTATNGITIVFDVHGSNPGAARSEP